jgi:hypothetical protein
MKRAVGFVAAGLLTLAACSPDQAPTAPTKIIAGNPTYDVEVPNANMPGEVAAHVMLVRGQSRDEASNRIGRPSTNLSYHGGPILATTVTKAIFWGTGWGGGFAGDKVSGLDSFYGGVGGSSYINTNTEYTGGNGQVTTAVSYAGHVLDTSPGPTSAPSTSTILAEVCKEITNPVSNGFYAVYTDLARGNAGYCAWHSAGSCGGVTLQFAFFFALDGDSGCNPGSNVPNQSEGLAALANVTGHELSEAMTDPLLNAWYDRQGAENADKCAWTFGSASVTLSNGSQWKVQQNWSNNAYTNGQGNPRGCIQTK